MNIERKVNPQTTLFLDSPFLQNITSSLEKLWERDITIILVASIFQPILNTQLIVPTSHHQNKQTRSDYGDGLMLAGKNVLLIDNILY